mmetsp:Transcript_12757/g.33087  ORF Transcript_12757/g.33087 Transcript_12757/m.33087 type:complete len:246 (+) Transcript_12757:791-1528(+)
MLRSMAVVVPAGKIASTGSDSDSTSRPGGSIIGAGLASKAASPWPRGSSRPGGGKSMDGAAPIQLSSRSAAALAPLVGGVIGAPLKRPMIEELKSSRPVSTKPELKVLGSSASGSANGSGFKSQEFARPDTSPNTAGPRKGERRGDSSDQLAQVSAGLGAAVEMLPSSTEHTRGREAPGFSKLQAAKDGVKEAASARIIIAYVVGICVCRRWRPGPGRAPSHNRCLGGSQRSANACGGGYLEPNS